MLDVIAPSPTTCPCPPPLPASSPAKESTGIDVLFQRRLTQSAISLYHQLPRYQACIHPPFIPSVFITPGDRGVVYTGPQSMVCIGGRAGAWRLSQKHKRRRRRSCVFSINIAFFILAPETLERVVYSRPRPPPSGPDQFSDPQNR